MTEEETRVATNLKRIWDDSDFQALWGDVAADVMQEWRNADTPETRERCHAELKALDKMQTKFRALMGAMGE